MIKIILVVSIVVAGFAGWKAMEIDQTSMNNVIAHKYIKAINVKDIETMSGLLDDDPTFIDALGNEVRGKERMLKGWGEYFKMFPDYEISTTTTYEIANSVALVGYAGENSKIGRKWRIPASFEAVIEAGKIKTWSVMADTKVPAEILNERQRSNGKEAAPAQKVTSIGGVFFKSKDPQKLRDWYKKHLGLDTDQYGTNFEWRQAADSSKKGFTQWSPFGEKTEYFEPSTKDFMVNYRVKDLLSLIEQLKKDGVTISDKLEVFEYGKFVHILDLEGNKIELWEPNDVEYDKIVVGRTK